MVGALSPKPPRAVGKVTPCPNPSHGPLITKPGSATAHLSVCFDEKVASSGKVGLGNACPATAYFATWLHEALPSNVTLSTRAGNYFGSIAPRQKQIARAPVRLYWRRQIQHFACLFDWCLTARQPKLINLRQHT